jgi:hypothetical protein
MAAKNFGRVNVSITASTGGLTAGLSRAGKQMRSFAGTVSSTLNPLRMLSNVAQSTFGQLALFSMARSAVNTLTGMASAAAENVDVQSKLSRRLGMTYAELSGLKLAGDLAGVGIESIGAAMTKADVAMQKAAGGSKAANAAFSTLGLSVDQLQSMSAADRFSAIAESISALPTSAERAAAAVALFGRSGAQLLPLFEGGAGSIARAREEAEKFGLALTNAQGQNVEEMNDSFTRVYSAIQGIIQQVTAYLAPAITAIAKQFTDFVGSVGGANIGQAIGEALLQGARFLAEIGDYLIQNLSGVFQYLSQVGAQWSAIFDIANRVAGFLSGVFNAFQAGMGTIVLGFGKVAEFFRVRGAKEFNKEIEQGILKDLQQRDAGFAQAFGESQSKAGEALAGPLTSLVDGAIAQSRAAAAAVDQKTQASVQKALSTPVTAQVAVNTEALKAIVAGTSEGEAFRNSLLRGADPRSAGAEEEKRTADATEETAAGVDELVSIMRDQFALAEITV